MFSVTPTSQIVSTPAHPLPSLSFRLACGRFKNFLETGLEELNLPQLNMDQTFREFAIDLLVHKFKLDRRNLEKDLLSAQTKQDLESILLRNKVDEGSLSRAIRKYIAQNQTASDLTSRSLESLVNSVTHGKPRESTIQDSCSKIAKPLYQLLINSGEILGLSLRQVLWVLISTDGKLLSSLKIILESLDLLRSNYREKTLDDLLKFAMLSRIQGRGDLGMGKLNAFLYAMVIEWSENQSFHSNHNNYQEIEEPARRELNAIFSLGQMISAKHLGEYRLHEFEFPLNEAVNEVITRETLAAQFDFGAMMVDCVFQSCRATLKNLQEIEKGLSNKEVLRKQVLPFRFNIQKLQSLITKRQEYLQRSCNLMIADSSTDRKILFQYELLDFLDASSRFIKRIADESNKNHDLIDEVLNEFSHWEYKVSDVEGNKGLRSLRTTLVSDLAPEVTQILEGAQEDWRNVFILSQGTALWLQSVHERLSTAVKREADEQKGLDPLDCDAFFVQAIEQNEQQLIEESEDELVQEERVSPPLQPLSQPVIHEVQQIENHLSSDESMVDVLTPFALKISRHISQVSDSKIRTEIRDHLFLAAQGLELFADAKDSRNGAWLAVCYRNFMIDILVALEQSLSVSTGRQSTAHSLIYLAEDMDLNLPQKQLLRECDKALVWLRYPETYTSHFGGDPLPVPLKRCSELSRSSENAQLIFEEMLSTFTIALEMIVGKDPECQNLLHLFLQLQPQLAKKPTQPLASAGANQRFEAIEKLIDPILRKADITSRKEKNLLLPIREIKQYIKEMKIASAMQPLYAQKSLEFWFLRIFLNLDKTFKHLFTTSCLLHDLGYVQYHGLKPYLEMLEDHIHLNEEQKALLLKINMGISHHYLQTKSSPLAKACRQILKRSQALTPVGFENKVGNRLPDLRPLLDDAVRILRQLIQTIGKELPNNNPPMIRA